MVYSYYRQRPRFTLLLVCVPLIAVSLYLIHTRTSYSPWSSTETWRGDGKPYHPPTYTEAFDDDDVDEPATGTNLGVKKPHQTGDTVPVDGIERYMTDYLSTIWNKFDDKRHLDTYGLKVGNVTLESYTKELEAMYVKFFTRAGSPEYEWLSFALSRLSLRPPTKKYPEAPRQLVTTDKDPQKLPDMFGEWHKKMPDTKLVAFDDRALEEWVEEVFGGTELHNIWRRLPRIVLKSDIFRYLVLLVEGGIYADSDTAPLIHADKWGRPYDIRTPEMLRTLTRVMSLASAPDADVYEHPVIDDGNELGPPALVVGVEFDCIMYGWNWREIGVSRAVQITQWVMQARPGHPVLLDVVGRALEKTLKIEKEEAEAKAKGEKYVEEWALEWTGPGVWTDSVYRYLLARYGFSPEDLIRIERPIRVGDVLILPSKTFAAGWPDENGKFQKDFDAVVHGFKGRWRFEDPAIIEINRINEEKEKLKKEEEERKKKEEEEKAKAEGKTEGQEGENKEENKEEENKEE